MNNISGKFQYKHFVYINSFLTFLIILSTVSISLETVPSLSDYADLFKTIEILAISIFSIEYIVRVYLAKNKLKYIFSFWGIIDLISVLPYFLFTKNLTYLKTFRLLRTLRFLKLLKNHIFSEDRTSSDKSSRVNTLLIEIYVSVFLITSFFSSVLIYSIENSSLFEFSTIPHAFLWSAKAVLGGAVHTLPETFLGNFVLTIDRMIGIILLALAINIIAKPIKDYIEKD